MIHRMKLNNDPYELIKKGTKKIELRLNDNKRRKIKAGDTLLFINTKTQKWIATTVAKKYVAPSFEELFSHINNKEIFGFSGDVSKSDMVNGMRRYYSEEREKAIGVVGIEINSPTVEMDFPVKCEDGQLKYVVVAAVYENKLVFCKHKLRNTVELPGGHIEEGETPEEAAIRELYEETGIESIGRMQPIAPYRACDAKNPLKGAYGMLFVTKVKELPKSMPSFEMERIELLDILPYKEEGRWTYPELPQNLTYFDIYNVLLYYIQRMAVNGDLLCEVPAPIDYYSRLKAYEEDVCIDYEHFDAEDFFFNVIMREDSADYAAVLDNVAATEENYLSVKNALMYTGDVIEYLQLLVDKYGADKVHSDYELMRKINETFEKECIEQILGR